MRSLNLTVLLLVMVFCISSCKKEEEPETRPDNNAPSYDGIPTVIVENYVNRLFIDLIGREPLDVEMSAEVANLRAGDLTESARLTLIDKLMFDSTYRPGDSSYYYAYYNRFYEMTKARLLEGASDADISGEQSVAAFNAYSDSLAGNWAGYQQNKEVSDKLLAVMASQDEYRNGDITLREMYNRMLNNSVYDLINMNSFNFINASFDDLFYRFPTMAEFDASYEMVEYSNPETLFGVAGQNKVEYIIILTNSIEYHEGMIRWAYLNLLAREPSTDEVYDMLSTLYTTQNIQSVQRNILKTDEYANF